MPRKKLSDQDKYQAVMDLLSGRGTHAEICNRHGISQTYLYKLRDRVLEAAQEAVKDKKQRPVSREETLKKELKQAKALIGDQALVIDVLKKNRFQGRTSGRCAGRA